MKLYFHPASTASRPVALFCAEAGISYEPVVIDLFTGKQFEPAYSGINPSCLVPTLDDDGFKLTESSTILKYLADKTNSPLYPRELRERARVNEIMDWFNTNFYREYGYHLVYPQTLPHMKLEPEVAQKALLERGRTMTERWLKVLDEHWLGDGRTYLCGENFTIADCLGSGIVSVGDWIGQTFPARANVTRWMNNVKARPSWKKVHDVHEQVSQSFKGGSFVHAS